MTNKKLKFLNALISSVTITIIFITTITVAADLYLPIKDWLKNIFSHHWIGKGVLSLVIFPVLTLTLTLISQKTDESKLTSKLSHLFWTSCLSSLIQTLSLF